MKEQIKKPSEARLQDKFVGAREKRENLELEKTKRMIDAAVKVFWYGRGKPEMVNEPA